jgi:hypothetical protein
MALSRRAREFAAEIRLQDWSDAPYRVDRAGHDRRTDSKPSPEQLTPAETNRVRMNAVWVVAQVLAYSDPNFDVYEFAEACGVDTKNSDGSSNGGIAYGLRRHHVTGNYPRPGTNEYDDDKPDA